MTQKVIFITGIDTDIGKTIATGWYANKLTTQGYSVITQKMVQTGCEGIATDIMTHRNIQGIELTDEDRQGVTCPYVFSYPCSPHLAARLEQKTIQSEIIEKSTALLCQKYDYVLLEGAGGLLVPYHDNKTTLDYIEQHSYPVILVTSGKLGSINHTLLSLEVCRYRQIQVLSLIYNQFPGKDRLIEQETQSYLQGYLQQHFPDTKFECLEYVEMEKVKEWDWVKNSNMKKDRDI